MTVVCMEKRARVKKNDNHNSREPFRKTSIDATKTTTTTTKTTLIRRLTAEPARLYRMGPSCEINDTIIIYMLWVGTYVGTGILPFVYNLYVAQWENIIYICYIQLFGMKWPRTTRYVERAEITFNDSVHTHNAYT